LKESAFNHRISQILSAKFFIRKRAPEGFKREGETGFWVLGKNRLRSLFSHTALYGDPIYVIPISDAVPRIFFPKRIIFSRDEEDSFEKVLMIDDFNREAVVEALSFREFQELVEPEHFSYEPGISGIQLRYGSSGVSFAVFSEQYFPGFRAYIDDKEERIYITDYLIRGVFLKPGEHTLRMVYEPWGFRLGLYISMVSILFITLISVYSWFGFFRRSTREGA
jgi:hypothetical protein